ncbi:MAG: hypothetical protein QOF89_5816 [Acidobacteriota bacterium]|nr:hypothetical protein [Acidobacteriota bacterium]
MLADAHEIFPPVVTIWANAIIVEIGIAAYLYALYEIMTSAQYIECKLTSLIHVGQAPFWQYEHYKKGGTPTLLWVFT